MMNSCEALVKIKNNDPVTSDENGYSCWHGSDSLILSASRARGLTGRVPFLAPTNYTTK